MAWLFFLVLGPVFAGVALALAWWLIWGRKKGLTGGSVRAFSAAAGLTLLFGGVAARLMAGPLPLLIDVRSGVWDWYSDYRFAIPLLLGILGLALVAFPVRARSGRGSAELTPRTAVSFTRGWWFLTPAVILALILVLSFAAGSVSQPDEVTGRYTMYFVDLGGERGMGTSIYGWFYSVPCLILMGLLIAVALIDLVIISRPALDDDQQRDTHDRTARSRNVILIGTGALLMHLGLIFASLAGTASVRSWFPTSEGGVTFWTSFAALQPLLTGASSVAAALGFALWAAVALSAIPSRRVPATPRS